MCPMSHMWKLEENFMKFVLFFHFGLVSGEIMCRVPGLYSKHLYLLSHLTGPIEQLKHTKSYYHMPATKIKKKMVRMEDAGE